MNLYNYIDDYGIYSFSEKKFNDIDAVILSFLSYANFNEIFHTKSSMTIKEAGRIHIGLQKGKDRNIMAVREANKLLRYIKDTKRYQDCKLFHYEYIGNDDIQFGAISIEFLPNRVFVSFEGTDQLFSGWKENFMLGHKFPTLSHKEAIKYLNKHFSFTNKRLLVGGHSKGGNLALVAGMYSNLLVRMEIDKVYNMDGPGLLEKEFHSKQYQKIKKKYTHILPNYSVVGLLLNHSNDQIVVSSNKGVLAHNVVYWQIEGTHFVKTKLSTLSQELDKEINTWYSQYKEEDKENFIINIDTVLKDANVDSILDLKEKGKNVMNVIREMKDIDERSRKMMTQFFTIILKCIKDVKKEEFKQFMSNFLKIGG